MSARKMERSLYAVERLEMEEEEDSRLGAKCCVFTFLG
jgi:hypothetical protein